MKPRLNVTEAERLRYSYRRLRAISRLREAGLEPAYSLYKEHRLPPPSDSLPTGGAGRGEASPRLGYRVEIPGGSNYYFERLADIEMFAEDYQLWQRARKQRFAVNIPFPAWQADPTQRMLLLVTAELWAEEQQPAPVYKTTHVPQEIERCSWERCPYPADGVIDGRAMCAGHAMVYGQMRLANDLPRAGRR